MKKIFTPESTPGIYHIATASGILITSDEHLTEEEQQAYISFSCGKHKKEIRDIYQIEIRFDGDWADVNTIFMDEEFERIRRITGYLVGDVKRFNNGKAAELRDRVKHGLEITEKGERYAKHGME